MFIGHFGLSLAAKKAAPTVSLGTLFIATQFVDLLWPFLLICHIETVAIVPGHTKTNAFNFLHFPYSHSLLMGLVWGIVVAGIYWLFKRDTRGTIVIGLCVLSHWFLDLIVHTADLPLTPFGNIKVGLGLWDHVIATLIVEFTIFLVGVFIYTTITRPKNATGKWTFRILVTLLALVQFANTFGPAPSDSLMILFASFISLMVIIVGLAYWADSNRIPANYETP